MNYRAVSYVLGKIFLVVGALMLLPITVSFYYSEGLTIAFLVPSALLLFLGILLVAKKPKDRSIFTKEGLVICGLSWILMSAFGALPFLISGAVPHYIDAFFETCSGFSTTGATIITEIEALPKSILFWRSFTHWIGGMGILSFMIALIPKSESHSMYIMKAEVPGPKAGKVVSKIQTSTRILYVIYCSLTLIEALILFFFTKMRFFDAVTTAFSTAGTGGFAVKNASILSYNSPTIEWILIVFMFLFGVNFNLYFFVLIRRFSSAFKDEEFWTYVSLNLISVVLITLNIAGSYENIADAIRDAAFNVNAIMSTTGFCTVDFNTWNTFSKLLLVALMFVGGSVGSTGGGMKVTRIMLYFKEMHADIKKALNPNAITKVRMNGNVVEKKVLTGINSYLIIYLGILLGSMLIISINGFDTPTTVTSVISCLNNVGPGLEMIGPTGNYASFSLLSKIVFCFDMLAGRLELFPILILFAPRTYKLK
ncbi:MAG: TrkH family potassium uptake protein [Eubacterium sp.]|nr:TrkH family potassium uptake protein [Eubacterium sp.]